jgi:hypothetical protein
MTQQQYVFAFDLSAVITAYRSSGRAHRRIGRNEAGENVEFRILNVEINQPWRAGF